MIEQLEMLLAMEHESLARYAYKLVSEYEECKRILSEAGIGVTGEPLTERVKQAAKRAIACDGDYQCWRYEQ